MIERSSKAPQVVKTTALRSHWHLVTWGVSLDTLAHAMRLATLRRTLRDPDDPPLEPVGSLAYYRRVLDTLTPEALDPGYVAYVQHKYQHLLASRDSATAPLEPPTHQAALFHRQNPTVSDRR